MSKSRLLGWRKSATRNTVPERASHKLPLRWLVIFAIATQIVVATGPVSGWIAAIAAAVTVAVGLNAMIE